MRRRAHSGTTEVVWPPKTTKGPGCRPGPLALTGLTAPVPGRLTVRKLPGRSLERQAASVAWWARGGTDLLYCIMDNSPHVCLFLARFTHRVSRAGF